jgi:hypothetical protein
MCDHENASILVPAMRCVPAIVRTAGVHSMVGLMTSVFTPALAIQILTKASGSLP